MKYVVTWDMQSSGGDKLCSCVDALAGQQGICEGVVVDAVEAAGESAVWGAQDVGLVLVDGERGS